MNKQKVHHVTEFMQEQRIVVAVISHHLEGGGSVRTIYLVVACVFESTSDLTVIIDKVCKVSYESNIHIEHDSRITTDPLETIWYGSQI